MIVVGCRGQGNIVVVLLEEKEKKENLGEEKREILL